MEEAELKVADGERAEKRRIWSERIRAWRCSGLSQAAYCREYGLKPKSFLYWKKRIGKECADGSGVKLVPAGLHAVCIPTGRVNGTTSLVVVVGRHKVEVGGGFDSGTLVRLIHTLERA